MNRYKHRYKHGIPPYRADRIEPCPRYTLRDDEKKRRNETDYFRVPRLVFPSQLCGWHVRGIYHNPEELKSLGMS